MGNSYLIIKKGNKFYYSGTELLDKPKSLSAVSNELRIKVLKLLAKKPMYPAELAKHLNLHEQKLYYHIKQMADAGVIEVAERKEIRGTTAKKFRPKEMNFAVSLGGNWKPFTKMFDKEANKSLIMFLEPFIKEGSLNSIIVVGSPDPHGPFKAYARDGHYSVDLALFFGQYCSVPDDFAVKLDVDLKLEKKETENLILVGGPVTNTIVSEINEKLPVKFSDKKPWGLISSKTGRKYTNDAVGIICKIKNPFDKEKSIMVIAGIRWVGTKAAVIALTRHYDRLLQHYTGQKEWAAVVEGFDLDGDGKIDSVEVLE